jgi:hypothetical protein
MNKNRIPKLILAAAFAVLLTACSDDDVINYPANASSYVYNVTGDETGEVTDNQFGDIYDDIAGSNSQSAQTLDNVLYNLAQTYLTGDDALTQDQIDARWHKSMLTTAKADTYTVDNYFDEYRLALSLRAQMYDIKTAEGKTDDASLRAACTKKIVTPEMEYKDVFALDYSDYYERYYKPTIYRNYLQARYIYTQSHSSIGSSFGRSLTAIKITDRTDKPLAAGKLINAFVKEYISDPNASLENCSLYHLARLWKGVDLTAEDTAFLTKYSLTDLTLESKIEEEVKKISNDPNNTDASLESTYTGTYTYTVEHGKQLAIDALKKNDLVTKGFLLKSSGLSDYPTNLHDDAFADGTSNYSTNIDGVASGNVTDKSYVIKHTNGYLRYVKPRTVEAGSSAAPIVTYDSSTSAYYLVQINMGTNSTGDPSLITDSSSRITAQTSDTAEVASFKKGLAMDVSYEMALTDTFKKKAITYYFTHTKIDYSDPNFYTYMKTNYPDCFNSDGYAIYEA